MTSIADHLVFLISAPRSGSTMLMRVLHASGVVHVLPEPHIIPPLAHLGFRARVRHAPYDPLQAGRGLRAFVQQSLPKGERDYLEALRACSDRLYDRAWSGAPAGARLLLDKTPANALEPRFLARLYPRARYLVLTRHPAGLFHSYAHSFFDGDFRAAGEHNPVLARYLPRIAWLLRQEKLRLLHVRYEDFLGQPERELARICRFLAIPCAPEALDYGRVPLQRQGPGDPTGVERFQRPEPARAAAWMARMDDEAVRVVAQQLARVPDQDLRDWGTPRGQLWRGLGERRGGAHERRWDRWSAERRLLRWGRKVAGRQPWRGLLRRLRGWRCWGGRDSEMGAERGRLARFLTMERLPWAERKSAATRPVPAAAARSTSAAACAAAASRRPTPPRSASAPTSC